MANGSTEWVGLLTLLAIYGHWTDGFVEETNCPASRPDRDKMTCLTGSRDGLGPKALPHFLTAEVKETREHLVCSPSKASARYPLLLVAGWSSRMCSYSALATGVGAFLATI